MTATYVPLGNYLEGGNVSYGIVQPGSDAAEGIPIVRAGDIRGGTIVTSSPLRVEADVSARHARTVLQGGELLFSVVGSVGETALVPLNIAGWNVARAVAVLRTAGVNSRWLHYFLGSPDARQQVSALLNTTVQPTLNLADLKRISVPVMSPPEQQAIAEVLGALDDKIAANVALAATSDELIRAEYTAFGSNRVRVSDVAGSPRVGVDPTNLSPKDLYVGLEHLGRRHMWLAQGGHAEQVSSAKSRFEGRDILFGKLRPYFHKVVSAPSEGICSTDIIVVRARDTHLSTVLLAALTSDAVIESVVAASEGTRMPRTSWKDLASVEISWPGPQTAIDIGIRLDEVRNATLAVLAENRTLAVTRDALLPQLMSGKLRVRDAEAAVSDAGV